MKKLLFIPLLFISLILSATDYYVKTGGDDGAAGTSDGTAWATITKVNTVWAAGTFALGDNIYFNKGDTWSGVTLTVSEGGTSGNPITIGAYGTGDDPIITGFTTLISWTDYGGGVYYKAVASEDDIINTVLIDDVQKAMGRYPNSSFLTYESFSTNVSITDNQLTGSPDWTGAEVIIRKNDWTIDRCLITNHSTSTFSYTSYGSTENATNNHGYFIQNDFRTLDSFGEWYYDGDTLFIYFGANDPASYTIKAANINNLVYNNGYDYITIGDISFIGSNKSIINCPSNYADYWIIQNCSIDYAGENGIDFTYTGRNYLIDNNIINHSGNAGMYLVTGINNTITNNSIKNSGLILGISNRVTLSNGIYFQAQTDGLIQYNYIDSTAYNGIGGLRGDNIEVRNNFINHSSLLLDDGAGIYTSADNHTGRIIDGNIVLNTQGNNDGTADSDYFGVGIYLDEYGGYVDVTNNIVSGCSIAGILLHYAHDCNVTDNLLFNNGNGFFLQNNTTGSSIHDLVLKNNKSIAKIYSQIALRFQSSLNDIANFGTADFNYYARPVDDGDVFFTYQPSTSWTYYTLSEWKSFTSQDTHSQGSPIALANTSLIHFYYNASSVNDSTFSIPYPCIDIEGKKYSSNITLNAWDGIVLLKDPNPSAIVFGKTSSGKFGKHNGKLVKINR